MRRTAAPRTRDLFKLKGVAASREQGGYFGAVHGRRAGSRRSPHQRLSPINGGSTQRSPSGGDGLSQKENDTTPQGAAIDADNVARVKHIYGYNSKRAVRVYFYDFDGACEYPDPDGELYEAFKKAGISASQPAVRTDAASSP